MVLRALVFFDILFPCVVTAAYVPLKPLFVFIISFCFQKKNQNTSATELCFNIDISKNTSTVKNSKKKKKKPILNKREAFNPTLLGMSDNFTIPAVEREISVGVFFSGIGIWELVARRHGCKVGGNFFNISFFSQHLSPALSLATKFSQKFIPTTIADQI